jgi:hypothetical protein
MVVAVAVAVVVAVAGVVVVPSAADMVLDLFALVVVPLSAVAGVDGIDGGLAAGAADGGGASLPIALGSCRSGWLLPRPVGLTHGPESITPFSF